ncbi:Srp72p [Tieghemiomyces parasiticus]|uniref:Signal recognition particle subunit SRP72 n=1 Tax=Tieghemiomyces parasiticus TaxID=78921 RepID=A0A9W8A8Z3_9FUNG|nr:Srp72p [Tieghemiomyces parasiticus]
MAATVEAYSTLAQAIDAGDFAQAVTICRTILANEPLDTDAYRVLVACLIREDKYAAALNSLASARQHGVTELQYEEAYCQYRTGDLADALRTLDAQGGLSATGPYDATAHQKLRAQIYYRQADYVAAMDIYKQLLQRAGSDGTERTDLLTNYIAAQVGYNLQVGQADPTAAASPDNDNRETYELAYNSACRRICAGQYAKAEALLQHALQICRQAGAVEQLPAAEVDREVAIIELQLGHVYQLQGKLVPAETIYTKFFTSPPAKGDTMVDSSTAAVVAQNLAAAGTHASIHQTAVTLRRKNLGLHDARLLKEQRRVLAFNSALLKFHLGRHSAVRRDCRKFQRLFPGYPGFALLQAATYFAQRNPQTGLAELRELTAAHPEVRAYGLAFTQAQLQMGRYRDALDTFQTHLQSLTAIDRYQAGPVAVLLWLYAKLGDPTGAAAIMKDANSHWTSSVTNPDDLPAAVLHQRGQYHLETGKLDAAVRDFQKLVQRDPTNDRHTAALVLALAETDVSAAQTYLPSLPTLPPVEDTAVDQLETTLAGLKLRRSLKRDATDVSTGEASIARKRAQRLKLRAKHRAKYATDSNAKVDPERWLPLHQRSNVKAGKGKRGVQGRRGKDGPQGSAIPGEESGLGGTGSANIGGAAPRPETPAEIPTPTPVSTKPSGKPKAKGKGRAKNPKLGGKW